MAAYIYSTLTADQSYKTSIGRVFINGGANLMTRRTLDTPRGVVTEITDEQFEALKKDSLSFGNHLRDGFVTADKRKTNANKVAEGLEAKDKSAQKTEAELMNRSKEKDLAKVTSGKDK